MTQPVEEEQQYEDEAVMETDTPAPQEAEVGEPDLEQQLAAERERSAGYLDELQRERASFINYRRRVEQEREGWGRDATAALVYNLLGVLDDFDRARANIPAEQQGTPWVEGLMLVGRKLHSTLELAGLKEIDAVGKQFDPNLHEAVSSEEVEGQEHGTILEEYRKGYMLGDRVLRPTMVKVAQ